MTTKFLLTEDELPSHWYNILADVPEPLGAFLSPQTLQPLTPPDLTPIFPMAIIGQEVSTERWVEIPDRVRDIYKMWRPTPLYRAHPAGEGARYACADLLQVRGHLAGGIAQAQHRGGAGVLQRRGRASSGSPPRPAPASGDRPWRSPGGLFGLEVMVYMVKVSYQQKPYRRALMETWGAKVLPSPTDQTQFGRSVLAQDAELPGKPRHRDLRSRRGCCHARRQPLLARLGRQPCPPAPDGHRTGGAEADGDGRRVPRRRHRVRRWWLQLRRARVPVPRRPHRRQDEDPLHRRRAGRVPDAHARALCLRLRRHRGHGTGRADVHARPQLHPGHHPRRRSPLSRRRTVAVPAREERFHRGACVQAERVLRGGGAVRAVRGHPARRPSRRMRSARLRRRLRRRARRAIRA